MSNRNRFPSWSSVALSLLVFGGWVAGGSMLSCSRTLEEGAGTHTEDLAGQAQPAAVSGTTYYVDSVSGQDANAGTTSGAPWKSLTKLNGITFLPGDRILLKSGSSWTLASGTEFHPLGSGSPGSPISIDMYGGTIKPVINGSGAPASNALHLSNQQYWEISNLEITNAGALSDNSNPKAIKHGVFVEANAGVLNHVYLRNLDVHDVYGYLGKYAGAKDVGGIVMKSKGGATARFNDILVDGCTVTNVDRQGITIGDIDCNGGLTNYSNTHYSTNVIIQNCTVDHPGGDGIVVFYCEGAIIQHCLTIVTNNKSDYACSIWPWSCTNTHIQYNEGYGAKTVSPTELDDGTFADADGENSNTYYDYNYSHDNAGGFAMICDSTSSEGDSLPPRNSYFRYNISRNEGAYVVYFSSAQAATSNYFYNNTFYQPSGCKGKIFHADSGTSTFTAKNNVFVNLGTGKGFNVSGTHVLDSNVYYGSGFSGDTAAINKDARRITTDPLLDGANTVTVATRFSDIVNNGLFQLKAGSPAIASGVAISGNLTKDFWGNTVSATAPSRGAHEYTGAAVVGITISPKSVSLNTGGSQSFIASVTGTTNASATWSATGGSVSATGVYTAPATAGTYTVKATSVADTSKSDTATVTVTAAPVISVVLSPKTATLSPGATQPFSASVTGTTNTAVTWSATGGSVSGSGLYMAPATAGTYTVKATSVADTSKSDTATITVTGGSSGNIAPSGTGYIWKSNSSATSNAKRSAKAGVNDNNLKASIVLNASGEGGKALWQGAGVVWSTARTVSAVKFINGTNDGYDNGFFQTGIRVQFSLDGTTWSDAAWSLSPAYPYTSTAWGQTYTFTGPAQSNVRGVRVVGQTGSHSWSGAVIELQAIGN